MLKIYLAGPDVFHPNYADICAHLKTLCSDAGFIGVSPTEGDLPPSDDEAEQSVRIFENNQALIRECDVVMANVRNFRGYEPDSGTCFEIGYAAGIGKSTWCYNVPTGCLVDQVPCDADHRDQDGYQVENFGLARNLMLAHSTKMVAGGASECILAIREFFQATNAVDCSGLVPMDGIIHHTELGAMDTNATLVDLAGNKVTVEFCSTEIVFRSGTMLSKIETKKSLYGRESLVLEIRPAEPRWGTEHEAAGFDVLAENRIVLRALSENAAAGVLELVYAKSVTGEVDVEHGEAAEFNKRGITKQLTEFGSIVVVVIVCAFCACLLGNVGWRLGAQAARAFGVQG